MGYSNQALKDSLNILKNVETGDFVDRIVKLNENFSGKVYDYECKFMVTWPKAHPDKFGDDIVFDTERQEFEEHSPQHKFYRQDEEALVVSIKTPALDHFIAQHFAKNKIEKLFALKAIYEPNQRYEIKHKLALVTNIETRRGYAVEPDASWQGYIRDSRGSEEYMQKFIEIESRLSSKDSAQLLASLQYHKIAMHSPTDEAKFVNLWIALESLVQDGGTNVIERIIKYIPASDSTNYIFRLMKYLSILIAKKWREIYSADICRDLPKTTNKFIHPMAILKIFLDEPQGRFATFITKAYSKNPLMIFKLERLWTKVFDSPMLLADKLVEHRLKLEWHLKRIYRARNQIMHQGKQVTDLRQLIQNLHSYYTFIYYNLINDLGNHQKWSIADAFEHRFILYNQYVGSLKNYDQEPVSFEMIFKPECSLTNRAEIPAWTKRRYPGKISSVTTS